MFWIRYKEMVNSVLTDKEIALVPAPTEIDYPEQRLFKAQVTQDGAVVVQRPLRDHRTRTWSWTGGWPAHLVTYETQWKLLETLEYRTRLQAGLPAYVEVWEDISGVGGFNKLASGARVYTKVKFLQVHRRPRKGGGLVAYDESTIEFVIEDDTYLNF